MSEILFAVGIIGLGVAPWLLMAFSAGGWAWFITISAIMAVVITSEIWNKITDRQTISQKFWRWSTLIDENGKRPNIRTAWLILGCYLASQALLVAHLAWRMLQVG